MAESGVENGKYLDRYEVVAVALPGAAVLLFLWYLHPEILGGLNQSGSKKMYSLGDRVLEAVLKSCPDEPNILKMAKGILKGSRALR